MNMASCDATLDRILDGHGVVGAGFRRDLVHDLKAKVLLRGARDAVDILGPAGAGRTLTAGVAHEAAGELLGRPGRAIHVDCSELVGASHLGVGLSRALDEAKGGTLVLRGLEGETSGRVDRVLTGLERDALIVRVRDAEATPTTGSARIRIKALHEREEDLWDLIAHFYGSVAEECEDHGVSGCRGFSRQANADLAEVIRETGLASVRKLQTLVRDMVFEALAEGPLPLKITSDMVRPYLEEHLGQTAEDRLAREAALVDSQFEGLVDRSLAERLATIHGVPVEVLERQAAILGEVIESIDDLPRSYRNIMDRSDDVMRASLWLLSGAETQAAFRRWFGDERFMRPTKSVAWAFYNRVFKRDC